MKSFNTIYSYKILNCIEIIQNINTPDSPELHLLKQADSKFGNFCSSILTDRFQTLEDTVSFFKSELCKTISDYGLSQTGAEEFLNCIIEDLILELGDICLDHQATIKYEAQTATKNFAFKSSHILKRLLKENFKSIQRNENWGMFLASNTDSLQSLSIYGGPAITTSLTMDNDSPFLSEMSIDFKSFVELCYRFHNTLSEQSYTWKENCPTVSYPISELAYYHLEKLWKIDYISNLVKQFKHARLFKSTFFRIENSKPDKPGEPGKPGKPAPLPKSLDINATSFNKNDFRNLFDFLERLEQINPSYLKTNLFLMKFVLTLGIDPDSYKLDVYDPLFVFLIPLIKNSFYYCITKSCIQEKITGKNLYSVIYDYCHKSFVKALKTSYTLPDSMINLPVNTSDLNEYLFSNIKTSVYKNALSSFPQRTVREIHDEITALNNVFDNITYSPNMFNDLSCLNELNSKLL